MSSPFSDKQVEFILNSNARYNIAHGAVRSGKTVCTLFRFLQEVAASEGSSIYIMGYSLSTIYRNVVSLIFDSEEFACFKPFCSWAKGSHTLLFGTREIKCIGCGDEGALGLIQGLTIDLVLCDEMTLYPLNVIDMLKTRLSRDRSRLFASMNPSYPQHKIKQWIDWAANGDKNYYALHFSIEDNPFLSQEYIFDLQKSLSGLFYKRNYLGIWCLAEGAIFDFFDRDLHVTSRPPKAADYWIAGLDYGATNPLACVLIGISRGQHDQTGVRMWAEKEYFWNPAVTHRQKTNYEFSEDIFQFLSPYDVKAIYVDPSAASFRLDLQKKGLHCVPANNEVLDGIGVMTSLVQKGVLSICSPCKNLIREIEGYVWDPKKAKIGEDEPYKVDDHLVDALRYAVFSHKVARSQEIKHLPRAPGYYGWG